MKYAIIDLDNCIADDAWRRAHINHHTHMQSELNPSLAGFAAYHALAPYDKATNIGEFTLELAKLGSPTVIISTGRHELFRAPTLEWLRRNVPFAAHRNVMLWMRGNADPRPAYEVKEAHLRQITDYADDEIVAAYDDHLGVLAMYERRNIPACRVDISMDIFHHMEVA